MRLRKFRSKTPVSGVGIGRRVGHAGGMSGHFGSKRLLVSAARVAPRRMLSRGYASVGNFERFMVMDGPEMIVEMLGRRFESNT